MQHYTKSLEIYQALLMYLNDKMGNSCYFPSSMLLCNPC